MGATRPVSSGVIRVAISRERSSIRFRNALKADSESAHWHLSRWARGGHSARAACVLYLTSVHCRSAAKKAKKRTQGQGEMLPRKPVNNDARYATDRWFS